jgi:hypothetical protein
MNDEPKSFWQRIWGRPVRFFLWLTILLSVAWIASSIFRYRVLCIPNWDDLLELNAVFVFFGADLLSVLGLILAFIRPTRPLAAWILRRWFFCAAAFATLIALFYSEENWRGKRAWEKCKHDLEAQGETLDWNAYVPPPVPGDQNFFKAPKMAEWFVGRGSNELSGRLLNPKTTSIGTATNTITTELEARDYLAWSDQFAPDFNLIREALKRPYARMDGDYSRPFEIPVPKFVAFRDVARTLTQRAHCYFLLRQPNKALAELTLVHDLCRPLTAAPTGKPMTVLAAMINVAITGLYVNTIGEGINLHVWQESQLAALEEQLGDIHLMPPVVEAMKTEPVSVSQTIKMTSLEKVMSYGDSKRNRKSFLSITPQGWIYLNLVNCVELDRVPNEGFDAVHDSISPRVYDDWSSHLGKFLAGKSPFKMLAAITIPNFTKAVQTTARYQTLVNESVVACALERYHIAHGEFPETLDALAPQFIKRIPHDIIGGQPLKYHRTADGKFVLYSVGWNEKDDGGIPGLDKNGPAYSDSSDLDWVWKYPAKSEAR